MVPQTAAKAFGVLYALLTHRRLALSLLLRELARSASVITSTPKQFKLRIGCTMGLS